MTPRRSKESRSSKRRQLPISQFFSKKTDIGLVKCAKKKTPKSRKVQTINEQSSKRMGVATSKQDKKISTSSRQSHSAASNQQPATEMEVDKSQSPPSPLPQLSSPQPYRREELTAEELDVQDQLESLDCSSLHSSPSHCKSSSNTPKSQPLSFASQPIRRGPKTRRVQCSPPKSTSHSSPPQTPKNLPGNMSQLPVDNSSPHTDSCTLEKSNATCDVPISNKHAPSDGNNSTPPRPCGTGIDSDADAAGKVSSDSDLSDDDGNPTMAPFRIAAIRRSARIPKVTDRYQPSGNMSKSFAKSSVFGYTFSMSQDLGKRSGTSNVERFLREYEQIEAQEEEVKKMREDLEDSGPDLDEGEMQFKNLADDQDEISEKERTSRSKYSDPFPIFRNAVNIQNIPPQLAHVSNSTQPFARNESEILSSCPLHDMLVDVEKCGHNFDLCSNLLGPFFKMFAEIGTVEMNPLTIQRLFRVCIFDDSEVRVEHPGREELFNALLEFIRQRKYETSHPDLPVLLDTLKCYGAVIEGDALKCEVAKEDINSICLDKIVREASKSRPEQNQKSLDLSMRNVRRALRFSAVQLQSNWPLPLVIGTIDLVGNDEEESVAQTVIICTKLLWSCFGSRLKRDVGLVIKAALARIDPNRWPNVRWKIAQSVMSLTSRLSLHVELVTYLFPMSCTRSLYCSLDIAYMSLYQWCEGPGDDPNPRSLVDLHPSDAAQDAGLDIVSFCIGDVLDLAKTIPDMNKTTDVVWICGLSRLLKQILTIPEVVKRRKSNEIGSLSQIIQKLRQCSHRVAFGVVVQDMRIALDTMIRAIRSMCSDKESRAELESNVKEGLVQATLK